MSDNSNTTSLVPPEPDEQDALRELNRSPHPYHHQSSELPHASEPLNPGNVSPRPDDDAAPSSPTAFPAFSKESTPGSESGTEADDEHFLKGLPAPRTKLHKGLRDHDEPISGLTTPVPSPATLEEDHIQSISQRLSSKEDRTKEWPLDVLRRNKVLVRRATEVAIVASLGYIVVTSSHVSPLLRTWRRGNRAFTLNLFILLILDRFPITGSIILGTVGSVSSESRGLVVQSKTNVNLEMDSTPNTNQLRPRPLVIPSSNHHLCLALGCPKQPRNHPA